LEDCDMIKYGDDISFYAKLKVILEKLWAWQIQKIIPEHLIWDTQLFW
jgi:hypothetical protein